MTDQSTGAAATLRLGIADDHPIVRNGLRALLAAEPDIEIAFEAADGLQAVEAGVREHPDVLLCDLRMPGRDGVEVTRALAEQVPQTRVIILTTYESDESIVAAIAAGAKGYLVKAAPADELLAGVRAVAAGEAALSPAVAARLVAHVHGEAAGAPSAADESPAQVTLTARELDVLTLVAAGLRNAQIAAQLFISEPTVKTHLLRIYQRLGVNDRTRAVTRAMELGLL